MRCFELQRDTDVSGISGTGTVAQGVQFDDGTVALRWRPADGVDPTTVLHPSVDNVVALHGHGGRTRLVWVDPPPQDAAVHPPPQDAAIIHIGT